MQNRITALGQTARVFSALLVPLPERSEEPLSNLLFTLNRCKLVWLGEADGSDPKLRLANNSHHMVRTVNLRPGKNILQIELDEETLRRTAYSRQRNPQTET